MDYITQVFDVVLRVPNLISIMLFVFFAIVTLVLARVAAVNIRKRKLLNRAAGLFIGVLAMCTWLCAQSIFFNNLHVLKACTFLE